MKKSLNDMYNVDFYTDALEGMSNSATVVLTYLYKHYQPKSIVDIGCGRGAWLAVAESLGTDKLKGFDGPWIKKEDLLSKKIDFVAVDFEMSMPEINDKYDLCISVEVAEHISETKAEDFVNILCKASYTVLFGAAIKDQMGVNHINEQWQSYWIDLFKSNGYECFDVLRPAIWDNRSVEWFYRQNLFLFVDMTNTTLDVNPLITAVKPIYDVVHPENYNVRMNQILRPTFRNCLACIKRYILRSFKS
jgi:SAM-dependent methyltransferase